MNGGKRTAPDAAETARRKRRDPPTIDLTATEVETGRPAPEADTSPKPEPQTDTMFAAAPGNAAPPPPPPSHDLIWRMAGAAGAGAALVGTIWLGVYLTTSHDDETRLSAIELKLQEVASRPAPAANTADLGQRLTRVEQAASARPASDAAANERMTALENTLRSLGVALTALTRRADDIAGGVAELRTRIEAAPATSKADLDAAEKRLAALEGAAKATQEQVAKAAAAPDEAARRALAAGALRDAAARNVPFGSELAAVKSLGGDGASLAPLEPFAQSGIPDGAALSRELLSLVPQMLKLSGADAKPSGFFERLQANASNLVRVRPVNERPGDDPATVLARIETKAARNDVEGARADLMKLPAKVRAPAEPWLKRVEARKAALDAAQKFAADAARSLGAPAAR